MHSENGTSVPTRSLDELADIAVRRGEHLRRRRHQIRGASAALVVVLLLIGVLRVVGESNVGVVDTRPADRGTEEHAPANTRAGDTGSPKSEVGGGGAPTVEGPAGSVALDVPSAADGAGPAAIAPRRLLYVVGGPTSGSGVLWQLDFGTGQRSRTDDASLCRPSVSPANGAIAYCKGGAVVIRDGEGARAPRVLVENATDPDFSPDGTRLAYVDRSVADVIWTMRVDGSDRRRLSASASYNRYPTWSPDGAQVAYLRGSELARSVSIVNADGSGAHEVTSRFSSADAYPLDWSPDGRQLAYTCAPSTTAVCLLDVASGESRAVTPDWLEATSPNWSPDGATIAFTAHPTSTATASEVWVMRADGTEERAFWERDTTEASAWFPVFFPVPLR